MSLITDRRWAEAVGRLDSMDEQQMAAQLHVVQRTHLEQIVAQARSLGDKKVEVAAEAARVRQLNLDWGEAVASGQWEEAVILVQAYNQHDLETKLGALKSTSPEKLRKVQYQAATMKGYERVRDVAATILSTATPATETSGDKATEAQGGPQKWVESQWSDPGFTGEQQPSVTQITKAQLYDEIDKVAPHLSRALKICLVGHAWQEQQGKGLLNYNFAGVEGKSAAYVMGWTSDIIATSTYENEPDKSKYRDWDARGHNPRYGVIDGHNAGTIEYQLALDPKPTRIAVLVRKRRPAYQSLSHAAASFVKLIELRVKALQASNDSDHNKLAEHALAGDAHAYAYIVNHSFRITDTDGKRRDFGAYNTDSGYGNRVERQIAAAETDLADKKDAPAESEQPQ
jgi:hypothetical protein